MSQVNGVTQGQSGSRWVTGGVAVPSAFPIPSLPPVGSFLHLFLVPSPPLPLQSPPPLIPPSLLAALPISSFLRLSSILLSLSHFVVSSLLASLSLSFSLVFPHFFLILLLPSLTLPPCLLSPIPLRPFSALYSLSPYFSFPLLHTFSSYFPPSLPLPPPSSCLAASNQCQSVSSLFLALSGEANRRVTAARKKGHRQNRRRRQKQQPIRSVSKDKRIYSLATWTDALRTRGER